MLSIGVVHHAQVYEIVHVAHENPWHQKRASTHGFEWKKINARTRLGSLPRRRILLLWTATCCVKMVRPSSHTPTVPYIIYREWTSSSTHLPYALQRLNPAPSSASSGTITQPESLMKNFTRYSWGWGWSSSVENIWRRVMQGEQSFKATISLSNSKSQDKLELTELCERVL